MLVHREYLAGHDSEDLKALLEAAGRGRASGQVTFQLLAGATPVGTLVSSCTGSQAAQHIYYILRCELTQPQRLLIRGSAQATWDRQLERFVLEARLGEQTYRLVGASRPGGMLGAAPFDVSWLPPNATPDAPALSWSLPDAPFLVLGALPMPDLLGGTRDPAVRHAPGAPVAPHSGTARDPRTGGIQPWSLDEPTRETIVVAGARRTAQRRVMHFGDLQGAAWTDDVGRLLRLDLPGGVSAVLVDEKEQ